MRENLDQICELLQDAYNKNWITSRDGNISWKPKGADYFYITPSGVRKQDLTPEQFKKLSLQDLTVLDTNEYKPSGEVHLHHGLLKQTDNEHFVVHLHPTYIVAAMHKGIELNQLQNEFPELSRYTKIAPNVPIVPPISQELAEKCIDNLMTTNNVVGITAHGVVSRGDTLYDAYEHIERLEHICKIVLASNN